MAAIFRSFLVTSIMIGIAAAGGQFVVLHAPPSLQFVGGGKPIEGNLLKDVYSASLGFSIDQTSDWDEMKLINPFMMPEAAVVVHVEGVSSIGNFDDDARVYPLDSYEAETYEHVALKISQRRNESKSKLVNMKLSGERSIRSYSNLFGDHKSNKFPVTPVKYADKHFYRFERELEALKAVTASVKRGVIQPDGCVDFYIFKFSSLRKLCDNHGPDSKIMLDAKNLLNLEIRELNKGFVASYNGDVMFTVVMTDDVEVLRQRRECDKCDKVCVHGGERICTCDADTCVSPDTAKDNQTKCKKGVPCICKDKNAIGVCGCKCNPDLNCTCPSGSTCNTQCVKKFRRQLDENKDKETEDEDKDKGTEDKDKDKDKDAEDKDKDAEDKDKDKDAEDKDKNKGTEDEDKDKGTEDKDTKDKTVTKYSSHNTVTNENGTDTAIINIISFTCIGLYLSLLAVVYTMVTMDPGRDSIVYRMTSALDRVKME